MEDGLTVEAIFTPGHSDDHTSFFIREEKALISGDLILGAPSTSVNDLDAYMKSLYKLRQFPIEWVLLPHSVSLDSPSFIMVEGPPKIEAYIAYREKQMLKILESFAPQPGESNEAAFLPRSQAQLYEVIYGARNLSDGLKLAAFANLYQQTEKLRNDGLLAYDEETELFTRVVAPPKKPNL